MKKEDLDFAFAVIEEALKENMRFTNEQKDLCVRVTIEALAPTERPWFYEVAQMNKIPLWQVLWGQWRRNQENGMAQAPICDPGWEGEITGDYGLEERECPICETVFAPKAVGQIYCSNKCGAEQERRNKPQPEPIPEKLSPADREILDMLKPPVVAEQGEKSVDLGTDTVELE